jgi:hypothetical protein
MIDGCNSMRLHGLVPIVLSNTSCRWFSFLTRLLLTDTTFSIHNLYPSYSLLVQVDMHSSKYSVVSDITKEFLVPTFQKKVKATTIIKEVICLHDIFFP